MSCNGCRVLRKGCSENCILRPCLQWIQTPEAQGHATVFVAKFFGRAGLMSFISAVPDAQRPALFQSLLFEAAGRTVNPVSGAVGLLGTGNWHVCQTAVETVLRGGILRAMPEMINGSTTQDETSEAEVTCKNNTLQLEDPSPPGFRSKQQQKRRRSDDVVKATKLNDLDLSLNHGFPARSPLPEKRRSGTPSMNSEESVTTTCFEAVFGDHAIQGERPKLLNLLN